MPAATAQCLTAHRRGRRRAEPAYHRRSARERDAPRWPAKRLDRLNGRTAPPRVGRYDQVDCSTTCSADLLLRCAALPPRCAESLRRCEKIACHAERSEASAFISWKTNNCRFLAPLGMTRLGDFFTPSPAFRSSELALALLCAGRKAEPSGLRRKGSSERTPPEKHSLYAQQAAEPQVIVDRTVFSTSRYRAEFFCILSCSCKDASHKS